MPWLKLLHAVALISWCGALLYLPALIAASVRRPANDPYPTPQLARPFFIALATPLALLTIISGTALFLRDNISDSWLILKLAAVAGMVLCHALGGALIVRAERGERVQLACLALAATSLVLILSVLGLVLGRPTLGPL